MSKFNRLLTRQIKRTLGGIENVPPEILPLLEAVNKSYEHYEDDRLLLERAMDLSSDELYEANDKLRSEGKKQSRILSKLKESLSTLLSMESGYKNITLTNDDDILEIIDIISAQAKKIKEVEGELIRIREFINLSSEGIFVTDEAGHFIFANKEACERMGYNAEALLGANIQAVNSKFSEPDSWERYITQLKTTETLIDESIVQKKDGDPFPTEINAQYLTVDGKGYVVVFARDITERKQAEERQKQLIDNLEGVNKELKDFAHVVSHDLKAPLRAIGSLADWIEEDYAPLMDEDGKEHLRLLKRRVERMHNLINGILQYSRVGRLEEIEAPLNLNTLVQEIIESIAPPPHFSIKIHAKLPTISNDETRMRQVFQNLISNAIKYNNKEQGKINISCEENGVYYKFCVADNGPGIATRHHDKIFKIFQTLNARDTVESTGVGLTVVKKIIENNNGQIWVQSEIDKGARFYFTLPKVST